MTEYWFYHLEASTLEGVLPGLLEKTRARGWRALIKMAPGRIAELDDYLWTFKDDAFLPHGRDDEPLADNQPILLSASAETSEGADCVFLVDGAQISITENTQRCLVMIDGRSDASIQSGRRYWKSLKDQGADLSYWQQNDRGSWEKKA